ncbi:MAG TPA: isochorismate synthase [Actinomycetota bacterium]|nr:isochorismate synthase [Actinomycetota bacterium]
MSETPLVARATRLGPAFDLLAAFEPGGFFLERASLGVSSVGTVATISVPAGPERILRLARRVAETLDAIHRAPEDPPPIAVTALTFDELEPAEASVPARATMRPRSGETWELETTSSSIPPPASVHERWASRTLPFAAFENVQLRPDPEPDEYAAAVEAATRRIATGELRKVVLARTMLVDAERALDVKQLLWRLRAVDPDCYAFATPVTGSAPGAILVGASPELLVRRRGRDVEATPLAGSAQRFGDPARDRAAAAALFRSEKDREEHAVVVEDVARVLGSFCDALDHPREPELLGTANVWHLATPFRGRLHADTSVLELVAALHPTPAVAGFPRDAAIDVLGELEPIDRGGYAGPLGWVDANGDGEFAIALRCAEITGKTARLFAGAGIVADSVPEAEVDETERKFRALLDALRWG